MYRRQHDEQHGFEDFHLSFGGKLRSDNRWVRLAKLIPWEQIESRYAKRFRSSAGPPALTARIAVGSLIIKEKLQLSDEETVEQIRENPYLQYFLGSGAFSDERPFDPSMMVHFRKRVSAEMLTAVNDLILASHGEQRRGKDGGDDDGDGEIDVHVHNGDEDGGDDGGVENEGTLLMDATCVPAAIRYPTDLSLLNEAREMTEAIIDSCHAADVGEKEKPRTYRRKARRQYLSVAKAKKPRVSAIRRALRQQLQYLRRNLETIRARYGTDLTRLSRYQYRSLLVANEVYRQQRQMYETRTHSVADRIVSVSQPHIRPIVRGKVATPVEFGAKISAAKVGDFAYLDRLSWDAYNEAHDLPSQVEAYRARFGRYPKTVHADAIYRTRENRRYCAQRGIRLGGPALGRPKQNPSRAERHQARDDERSRIPIEGVFGRGKTRYSLSRIMAKRRDTSETVIALAFVVMNLDTLLRRLSLALQRVLFSFFGYRSQRPIFAMM